MTTPGPRNYPCPIIAVGASAGGLESLERFFGPFPKDTAAAFVVIQHLSPHFRSLMDELLSRRTALAVKMTNHRDRVEPGTIYLLPPGQDMVLKDGRLLLCEKEPAEGVHHPIDRFLHSLADETGEEAVGVILSGTGTDGSTGVRAIHEAGGWTLAEDDSTAKFSGMPRSAHATGCVDQVLAAERMAPAILQHLGLADASPDADSEHGGDVSARVLALLKRTVGHNFGGYKPAMVQRRIARRMSLSELDDHDEYIRLLQVDAGEREALAADLLIGVTRFFRDPACFEEIERTVLPRLVERATAGETLRVWVPACSTGQEAYSLAMMLREQLSAAGCRLDVVKVFATDMHRDSLAVASFGTYTAAQVESLSHDRLASHFRPVEQGYQVVPELRNMVVFAPHDVLSDAPFTNLDLISCRNLLIYFDEPAQRRALSLFHFALIPGGQLVLGPSESPGRLGDLFETIDERCRIFLKSRDESPREPVHLPFVPVATSPRPTSATSIPLKPPGRDLIQLYDCLLDRFMPPSILIDDQRQVVDTFAGAQQFLEVRGRRMSIDVLDLIKGDIRGVLGGAIRQAQKENRPFTVPALRLDDGNGEECEFDVCVEPVQAPRSGQPTYLISLRPVSSSSKDGAEGSGSPESADGATGRRQASLLEEELRFTRMSLQSSIEELEASNEKLQTTNEELVAANEELQSTNEELNSVNEELYTVNTEYQNTISALRELNGDMEHLFASADVRAIFLDSDLRLRRFTPSICDQFHLESRDIGRSLKSFSHRLDCPDLHASLERVAGGGTPVEREVKDTDGTSFYLRILPYRTDGETTGVVLTLIDIENLVVTRRTLLRSEERLRQLTDALPILISYVDRDLVYRHVNTAYTTFWNRPREAIEGRTILEVVGERVFRDIEHRIHRALNGEPLSFDIEVHRENKSPVRQHVAYVPNLEPGGVVAGFFVAATDVTEQHRVGMALEKALKDAKAASEAKSEFLANMSHEIRSPMTAILGFADILAGRISDPQNLGYLQTMQRNGHHLLTIINDILDLSRVEAGKLDIAREDFSPVVLLNDVLRTMEVRAVEKGLVLIREFPSAIPARIHSDPRRIRQILINLIGNAIKFTSEGAVTVRLGAERSSPLMLRFEVIDTGCGIPREHHTSIFAPFTTADGSSAREYEGSGLGLAISQRLAHLLEGEIILDSEPGRGSRFTLRLPITVPADLHWVEPARIEEILVETEETEPPPNLDCRVLVVDDRRDNQLLVRHILEEAGATVTAVSDGIEAIQVVSATAATQTPFECIVLDMQMPGLDGHTVASRLRDAGYDTPIIALTAGAMKGDRDRCLAAGCNAYLAKPIDGPALIRLIADLVEEAQQTQSSAAQDDGDTNTVLVVEDNRDACDAISALLRMSGFDAQPAYSLGDARKALAESLPGTILLDAHLPDGDGIAFGRDLKQDPRYASTVLIGLTGDDEIARGDTGLDAMLSKPVELPVLLSTLRESRKAQT